MYLIRLGNPAPVRASRDENDQMVIVPVEVDEPAVTVFECNAPTLALAFKQTENMWGYHGAEPPSWVATEDEGLEALLASHFGCERGEPKGAES